MAQVSSSAFETVWNDGEFILSRSANASASVPVLALAPVVDQPAPSSIARLEHAYALRNDLDSHWAARPLELIDDHGKPALLIEDHGYEIPFTNLKTIAESPVAHSRDYVDLLLRFATKNRFDIKTHRQLRV